jgi:hypothetical protein
VSDPRRAKQSYERVLGFWTNRSGSFWLNTTLQFGGSCTDRGRLVAITLMTLAETMRPGSMTG